MEKFLDKSCKYLIEGRHEIPSCRICLYSVVLWLSHIRAYAKRLGEYLQIEKYLLNS